MSLGATFTGGGEADLIVTIEEIQKPTIPLLMEVSSSITHLILKGRIGESPQIKQLLPKCRRLMSFALSDSKGCDLKVFSLLPRLRELILRDCSWLHDQLAMALLSHLSGFRILDVSENSQLAFAAFRAISQQADLEILNCVYCAGLEDGFLENIARGCPHLRELRIAWCKKLTDSSLRALGIIRPTLELIDISNCTKISDAGIHDMVRPSNKLQSLSMQHLPLVSEEGILQIPALCQTLRSLDITLCNISEAGVMLLRERYPALQVINK